MNTRIVSLTYDDFIIINNKIQSSPILIQALDDLNFTSRNYQQTNYISDNLFLYELFINDLLFGICYGIKNHNNTNLDYNIIFDQTTYPNQKHKYTSFIGYFIHHIIHDTFHRLNNQNNNQNTNQDKKQPFDIYFQFDLTEQFNILSDYSFLTRPPYSLSDMSHRRYKITLS